MDSDDLISILTDMDTLPLVFRDPNKRRLVIQKIEVNQATGEPAVHIDLGFYEPSRHQQADWQSDASGN
jgi:hypothetical protein